MPPRPAKDVGTYFVTCLLLLFIPTLGFGQTIYSWNNIGSDWNAATNWTVVSGSGMTFPGSSDTAQFTGGTFATGIDPILGSDPTTITQLRFSGGHSDGWLLSGSSTLTTGTGGTSGVSGIVIGGGANYTINLGTGSATSLTLNGPTGGSGGAVIVGSGSLRLTGNTIASTVGTSGITIRSGTLILDNSAGNPSGGQRLTSTGPIALTGGGSMLEFRGAASGTTFNGLTGSFGAGGGGDTYIRTVQDGTASLAISLGILSRVMSGSLLVENIGSGFVGDSGKPTVTISNPLLFTSSGVLSSTGAATLPWVAVTQRASAASTSITGRWANYSGGMMASAPTAFTDNSGFSGVTAGANVLFNPSTAGSVTLGDPSKQLSSVVLEPGVAGVTLNVGTGLNTFGLLHSGTNDITVDGTNLLSTTTSSRTVLVLSATAALSTSGSLNIVSTSNSITLGGNGFVILTGSGNQITSGSFTTTASLNLGGGVLRGTAANLNFTAGATGGARLNFRGGVLEYDVSADSATFNLVLGTTFNQVNWTMAANNVGGGGFSAYSTNSNNSLLVSIVTAVGSGGTLYWNDAATSPQSFITDGYALKFGSLRSNARVIWQNPIALDGSSGTEGAVSNTITSNRVREINVTRGIGNSVDLTQLAGVISGSPSTDLLKTGSGVLVLTGSNTYSGNTYVDEGELRVVGQLALNSGTGTGRVTVRDGGTLGGDGQALGPVSILGGGFIRGGDGAGVGQFLTTGTLNLYHNSTIRAVVASGVGNIDPAITGASLIVVNATSTFARSSTSDTIHIVLTNDGTLNLDGTTSYTRRLVTYPGLASNLAVGTYSSSNPDFTVDGSNFAVGTWSVLVAPSTTDITFTGTPVPEHSNSLLLCVAMIGVAAFIRRWLLVARTANGILASQ